MTLYKPLPLEGEGEGGGVLDSLAPWRERVRVRGSILNVGAGFIPPVFNCGSLMTRVLSPWVGARRAVPLHRQGPARRHPLN